MDDDIATNAAVLNGTIEVPCNAANKLSTSDAGIGQRDVLDGGTNGHAEEALIPDLTFVDTDTADFFSLTVEGAAEGGLVGADGDVVVLGVCALLIVGLVAIRDVITQTEEIVLKIIAAVHQRGQQVEAVGGGDGVGLCGRAAVVAASHIPEVRPQCLAIDVADADGAAIGGGAVGQRLAVLHGRIVAVAVGIDVVGGVGPAQGDVAASLDANAAVATDGANDATVDGDVTIVGKDAITIQVIAGGTDSAAVDGDGINNDDAVVARRVSGDATAIDGQRAIVGDGCAGFINLDG